MLPHRLQLAEITESILRGEPSLVNGREALKALQVVEAIYHGAPIVTTAIGAEGIFQVEDVLLIEDEPESFADAVAGLYQNPDECRKLCRRTQEYIRGHFSVDAAWRVIAEDFE